MNVYKKIGCGVLVLMAFVLFNQKNYAISGQDVLGGIGSGLKSAAGLLMLMDNIDNLKPNLEKTEAAMTSLIKRLNEDTKAFALAKKNHDEKAQLNASRNFMYHMGGMKAIGGFLNYTVESFRALALTMNAVPGASGKIMEIARQIKYFESQISVVWKISAAIGESMHFNCLQGPSSSSEDADLRALGFDV